MNCSNLFLLAINMGDIDSVKCLLPRCDINFENGRAIKCACNNGDLNMFKFLVENNAEWDFDDELLFQAGILGHLDIVKYMIHNDMYSDVETINKLFCIVDETIRKYLITAANEKCLLFMLSKSIEDKNLDQVRNIVYYLPFDLLHRSSKFLLEAIQCNNKEALEYLIAYGIEPNCEELLLAACSNQNTLIVQYLNKYADDYSVEILDKARSLAQFNREILDLLEDMSSDTVTFEIDSKDKKSILDAIRKLTDIYTGLIQ